MATPLPLVGQAVVTLPGTTRPGDERRAVWSPAVSDEDRAHLGRVPQASDYLHRESSARGFFSFYRLPGGGWAFGRTRRGALLVRHTLVLPGEVMDALEWEPRLLPACSFQAAGQEWSFDELTLWEGEMPDALPDLEVVLPTDGTARRYELVESRRRFLEERWGRDGLESALAQALSVLKEGKGLLLPQGHDYEQLLALLWSSLPPEDRSTVPWTTHLAPGDLNLFRLANVPNPDETLAGAGPSWSLLPKAEDEALAERIDPRHVIVAVAAAPAVAPLLGEHLDRALQELPEVTEALFTWPGALYDRAVAELRRWLREAPQAVLQETGFWNDGVVLARPSILGLAETLAGCGIPAEHWVPFALAEATVLDQIGNKSDVQRFSASLSFPAGEVRRNAATRLCRRLVRESLNPGAAHRALVVALAGEIATQAEQAVAVLASLSRLPEAELRAWGGPIAEVAEALHRRGHRTEASTLASNWLKQMAVIPWGGLPREAIDLLDFLSEADRRATASVWGSKLTRITPAPEEKAVFVRFRDRLLLGDPKLRRRVELSEIRTGMLAGRLTFHEVAERIHALVPLEERERILLAALAESLPAQRDKRLQALFELVLSPRLLPSAQRLVQEKLFWPALQQAGRDLFRVLPPVTDLARRGAVLLRVFRRMGEVWKEDPFTCYDRLQEALKLGRLDAVAAFLHGTASVRPSFLKALASKHEDEHLLASLRRVAREPRAALDLAPFLSQIRE